MNRDGFLEWDELWPECGEWSLPNCANEPVDILPPLRTDYLLVSLLLVMILQLPFFTSGSTRHPTTRHTQHTRNIKITKSKVKCLRPFTVYGNGGTIGNVYSFTHARYCGSLKREMSGKSNVHVKNHVFENIFENHIKTIRSEKKK